MGKYFCLAECVCARVHVVSRRVLIHISHLYLASAKKPLVPCRRRAPLLGFIRAVEQVPAACAPSPPLTPRHLDLGPDLSSHPMTFQSLLHLRSLCTTPHGLGLCDGHMLNFIFSPSSYCFCVPDNSPCLGFLRLLSCSWVGCCKN